VAYNAYSVPQPPPPKKTWRTVLIVVGAVVVLCCVGAGVGGFFLFKNVKDATAPAAAAAERFVTSLEQGDTDGAYAQLCGDTQRNYTKAVFADGVAKQPKIKSHKLSGINVANMNGRSTGVANMALTLDSGFTDQHSFPLLKESGTWKVCGRPY
jgi:diaminopimelate epimerase